MYIYVCNMKYGLLSSYVVVVIVDIVDKLLDFTVFAEESGLPVVYYFEFVQYKFNIIILARYTYRCISLLC